MGGGELVSICISICSGACENGHNARVMRDVYSTVVCYRPTSSVQHRDRGARCADDH